MENSNIIIKLENFSMTRNRDRLLDGVELEINRGDVVFFLGNNGCGKSTMLSLFRKERDIGKENGRLTKIAGKSDKAVFGGNFFITCKSETYNLTDCDFGKGQCSNFYYENIAYLDQSDLYESFAKVERTLRLPTEVALFELFKAKKTDRTQYTAKREELNKEVARCMNILQQSGTVAVKRTGKLSGGQKRLVSFFRTYIRAVVLGAQVLVMDEPLNHLDCEFKKTVNELLSELIERRKSEGNPVTLLIVSHCLPFTFIKDDNCRQFRFTQSKGLEEIREKRYYTCLTDENEKEGDTECTKQLWRSA